MRFLISLLAMTGMTGAANLSRIPVTFHADVLPILVKNCQGCHSMGRLAPMPFTTYEETRPWAAAIRAVVVNKKMPPWINDAHPGLFGDDGRLTQADVEIIIRWVEDGAPEGAPDARNRRREK